MGNYKFQFENYRETKTKHQCPSCQKAKVFVLYIDTETKEPINASVGRCDRESKCGYHYTPKDYFHDNQMEAPRTLASRYVAPAQKPASYIDPNTFRASLQGYEGNHFVTYLLGLLGEEVTTDLIGRYFIGSSNHWQGATIFWQIDTKNKIRTGKIMQYSPSTGKRVKEPYNHISWVHAALKLDQFELRQCLFGEHLLTGNTKPVAIVESEKTAIIASAYQPQYLWLACGGLSNLDPSRLGCLKGRKVTLFPDLKGFEKWSEKAKGLSAIGKFEVSKLLEGKATETERDQGLDLADYLIRFALPPKQDAAPVPALREEPTLTIEVAPAIQASREVVPDNEDLEYWPQQPKPKGTPEDIATYQQVLAWCSWYPIPEEWRQAVEADLANLATYGPVKYAGLPSLRRLYNLMQSL